MNVYTLKYGDKYPSTLVNSLYAKMPSYVRFHCMTDDASGLDDGIIVLELEERNHWQKLRFFDIAEGESIVMDIDQLIVGDIEEMLLYPVREKEIVSYDRWWYTRDNCKLNGGWYKFIGESVREVWEKYCSAPDYYRSYYYDNGLVDIEGFGEQNFVSETIEEIGGYVTLMPAEWAAMYHATDAERNVKRNKQYHNMTGDFLYMDGEWSPHVKIIHWCGKDNNVR